MRAIASSGPSTVGALGGGPSAPEQATRTQVEASARARTDSAVGRPRRGLTPGAMSEPTVVTGRPMSTAFASYSAQDGTRVKQCLSALKHWDPDVEVFIDCLDLRPNDDWKRQLEYEIPTKDAFLLFWSVNAMKSKCVAWEISVAEAKRGLAYIRPMPLDMPDLAPPPERLKHLHFSDRYLAAQQANWMRQSSGLAWLSELQRVTIGAFRRAFGG